MSADRMSAQGMGAGGMPVDRAGVAGGPGRGRRAPVDVGRSRRWGAWYVAEHRLRVMRSYVGTVVISAFGNPLLYLYAMGVGLGGLIGANMGAHAIDGVGYLQFVAPALLCSAGVTVAFEELSYPVMGGFKWNPTFFGMNASPISPGQIASGMLIATTVRILVVSGLYYVFMLLFGAVPSAWGVVGVGIATLTALAFGAPLMAYVATLRQDSGQISMVMRFVVLPLTLFSGTFFPLTAMPVYLQWIGWISPLWHGVQLARVVSYGSAVPGWLVAGHLAYLVAFVVVFWLWCARITRRRLNS